VLSRSPRSASAADMAQTLRFTIFSRVLHWTMAVMVLAMLFIGVGMVASLSNYHWLVSIHKPLGILILILVAIRLVTRLLNPAPPLPEGMPLWQRVVAHGSHVLLYVLMFALPLVGWGMLSAARYPIVLYGPLELPPILPHSAALYAVLRTIHTALAFILFATFVAHLSAALMHALVYRDGVFQSMAPWRTRTGRLVAASEEGAPIARRR
jgi:cytochrome b561